MGGGCQPGLQQFTTASHGDMAARFAREERTHRARFVRARGERALRAGKQQKTSFFSGGEKQRALRDCGPHRVPCVASSLLQPGWGERF